MTAITKDDKKRITVNSDTYTEFISNVIQIEGYTKEAKSISANKALKLYNNYCKPYKNKKLIEVAKENDLEVWELGEILISRFMMVYTELGLNVDFISNDEHFKLVLKYIAEYKSN